MKVISSSYLNLQENTGPVCMSILAFLIILVYTRHGGIGISPDSIVYLSVARNLHSDLRLVDYAHSPLVDFPVFYPIFLAAVEFISRTELIKLAEILNGVLFAIVILLSNSLIKRLAIVPVYRNLLLLILAISPALLDVYGMLWSESLFLLLSLCCFITISSYLRAPTLRSLLLSCIPVAFACITRYAGVTIVGTGLYLIFFHPALDLKAKIKHLFVFGAGSLCLLVINLLYNAAVTGTTTGPRERGIVSLHENFSFFAFTIADWFPVFSINLIVTFVFGLLILILFSFLLFQQTINPAAYGGVLHIMSCFVVVYVVFIVGISTLTHFEQLNNRFLSPVYIPMIITVVFLLFNALRSLQINFRLKVAVGVLAASLFLFNEINISRQMFEEALNYGVPGYSSDSWKLSSMTAFLKKNGYLFKRGYPIYSNAREALYFLASFKAGELPHKVDALKSRHFLKEKGNYLIWYYGTADVDLLDSVRILRNRLPLQEYKFEDGSIFFLKAR
jgi:hypothetical protein